MSGGALPYTPRPIDTSAVELQPAILELTEALARHNHDLWARGRMAEGWSWGPRRDDAAKKHPQLVPYDDLPESERQYDRNAAVETLKAVLQFGFTLERADPTGPAHPSRASRATREGPLPPDDTDAPSMLDRWRNRTSEGWSSSPAPYRALAASLRRVGEPLVAYDVVGEGLTRWASDLRLLQLKAMILADLGRPAEAADLLEPLRAVPHDDQASLEETLGGLGRAYKDLALATFSSSARRRRWLEQSFAAYAEAFDRTGGYWTGINAATTAVLRKNTRVARRLATAVERRCLAMLGAGLLPAHRYWVLATLGEAALVREQVDEACAWYAKAVASGPTDARSVASSRRNAKLLADRLGLAWNAVAATLPLPTVVVFAGDAIDRLGRPRPRLPSALEPALRTALDERLDRLGPVLGYGSAASASEIVFLEAVLHRRQEAVVVPPYLMDGLRRDRIGVVPGRWGERFDSVLARAHVTPPVSNQRTTWGSVYQRFATQVLLGLATLRAQELGTRLVGLAAWDGRCARTAETAATIALWNRHGVPWEWIDVAAIRCGAGARRRPVPRLSPLRPSAKGRAGGAVRSLLFADITQFSKIPEEMLHRSIRHVFGIARRLAVRKGTAPIGGEPRGDGFYLVFATARAAGRFALALNARLAAPAAAAPGRLLMRIGLHAGVVYRERDPMTGQIVHIGTHVSRASRIEPVTPPGQVYASQEFAALAALERVGEFSCNYVGQIALPKDYGVFPMYRLTSTPGRSR